MVSGAVRAAFRVHRRIRSSGVHHFTPHRVSAIKVVCSLAAVGAIGQSHFSAPLVTQPTPPGVFAPAPAPTLFPELALPSASEVLAGLNFEGLMSGLKDTLTLEHPTGPLPVEFELPPTSELLSGLNVEELIRLSDTDHSPSAGVEQPSGLQPMDEPSAVVLVLPPLGFLLLVRFLNLARRAEVSQRSRRF